MSVELDSCTGFVPDDGNANVRFPEPDAATAAHATARPIMFFRFPTAYSAPHIHHKQPNAAFMTGAFCTPHASSPG